MSYVLFDFLFSQHFYKLPISDWLSAGTILFPAKYCTHHACNWPLYNFVLCNCTANVTLCVLYFGQMIYSSGRSRGGPSPLFWVKTENMWKGRTAGRAGWSSFDMFKVWICHCGEQWRLECLCLWAIGLIIVCLKFDVLKTSTFALRASLLGQIFVLRTSNFCGAAISI